MAKLDLYHQKRDFKVTAEPRGKIERVKKSKLRFVIQRHDATRLHYDFRLELGGVYKSWAITKVPSLDPATKRLAVEVENHPIDYGTFEGVIPAGEYGGGTVQLWDRGTWAPQGDNPERDIAKGQLKIVLDGERMHGKWALIRLKDEPVRPGRKVRHNWLLIKEKDDEARPGEPETLAGEVTSVKTGRTLEEIAANKRARVWHSNRPAKAISQGAAKLRNAGGAKKKDSNVVVVSPRPAAKPAPLRPPPLKKGPMPQFVEPELARLVSDPPGGAGWAHEAKFDGYRMQLRVESGKARFRTRKGLDWSERFSEIVRDAERLPNCMIDGEVCALDAKGMPDFGALQDALSTGETADLIYYVFDLLFLDGHDLRNQPLRARKDVLKKLLKSARVPARIHYVEHFTQPGAQLLKSACEMGLEGIISKRLEAPYVAGRGDFWLKSKCRGGQEVVIGGWWGDATKIRSLLAGVYDGRKFTYVGNVGTGFNAKNAPVVLKALRPLKQSTSPFQAGPKPPRAKEINWVEPKVVAEIEFAGFTHDGNIRQAAFKGLREDKSAKSIVRERAAAPPSEKRVKQEEAEVKKKPSVITVGTVSKSDAVVAGVTVTHPAKALWPADGKNPAVTKLDLARYYEAVAHLMLPHIAGRPISLVRAPDGITGERFFQRHVMPGLSEARPVRVRGENKPYLMIDSEKGIVQLAQVAVLEIHPWGCKPNEPEIPQRLIFDLDPEEGLPFQRVIDAAKELRERLVACGLEPFVKTTGGKGLHVATAIKGSPKNPIAWPEAKEFSRVLCEKMAKGDPGRYTTNMAKKQRGGKIFLDYLRNDRTSTAVGAWSTRARPGATIALPIPWSQVKAGLDPKRHTIFDAGPLIKRGDPWKDMDKSAASLEAAAKKLAKL